MIRRETLKRREEKRREESKAMEYQNKRSTEKKERVRPRERERERNGVDKGQPDQPVKLRADCRRHLGPRVGVERAFTCYTRFPRFRK